MRRAVLAAALAVAAPSAARADLVSTYAQLDLGLSAGTGVSGQAQDVAFHDGVSGAGYGVLLGVELLYVDLFVQHDQFLAAGHIAGTWTQFMVGFDVAVDLGERRGGTVDARGVRRGGYALGYAEIGSAFGFGVGTGRQVDPPLDNSEVTDKGFVLQGGFGGGVRLNPWLSAGASVPVSLAYLIKNGPGAVANDSKNHYLESNVALIFNLRATWQLRW